MHWFSNLKTINKIILLVLLMIFFTAITGFTGYFYAQKAHMQITEVYHDRLLPVQWLNEARVQNRSIQVDFFNLITTDSNLEKRALIDDLQFRSNYIDYLINKYEKSYLTDFEGRIYEVLKEKLDEEHKVYKKIIALENQGKTAEAYKVFFENNRYFDEIASGLKTLSDYNQKYAHEIHKENTKDFDTARKIIITVLILAVFLSLALGIFTANKIAKPIILLLEKVKQLAKGNLDIERSQSPYKDEIGELNNEFNSMSKNIKNLIEREKFLREIIVSSISSMDTKDILSIIVTETGTFYGADRCFFIEYDEKTSSFKKVADYESYTSSENILSVEGFHFTRESMAYFLDICLDKKQIVVINNVEEAELPEAAKNQLNQYDVKSVIMTPVMYKDIFLGLLIIDNVTKQKTFTEEEVELIKTITNQSAIVFYQAKLYEKIQKTEEREIISRNLVNKVLDCRTIDCAKDTAAKELKKIFGYNISELRFFDAQYGNFINIPTIYANYHNLLEENNINTANIDKYIINEVFEKKENLNMPFTQDDKYPEDVRKICDLLNIESVIYLPLTYREIPFAGLFLGSVEKPKVLSNGEYEFLQFLMPQISACISMFYLNKRLKESSNVNIELRKIITKIRTLEDHDEIFDYFMEKLVKLFDATGAMHIHYDNLNGLCIKNIYSKDKDQMSQLRAKKTFCDLKEKFIRVGEGQILIVNDVEKDFEDESIKNYFKEERISSFILYPIPSTSKTDDLYNEMNIIFSSYPRVWSSDETDYFKLIIDTISVLYYEIKQRVDLEKTKSDFMATLTHDLKSPIIAEQKALEVIMTAKPETPIGKYFEYFEDFYNTNEELLKLINNLLSVFYYESGAFQLAIEANSIEGIVHDSVRSMKHYARSRDCEIVDKVESDLPPVFIDGAEVKRVLINLISNAIKHTKTGTKININVEKSDNKIVVSVSDNGQGIPEENKPMIFEKYQTTKRKVGTGLGLYLSKQIIEAHGGKIWFESEEGKGTTFFFTLPL